MKRYYVHYYRDFVNTYNLYWAETPKQIEMAEKYGYDRISRKEAEELCASENCRRKNDSSSSGFASSVIYPIDYEQYDRWGNRIYNGEVHKEKYLMVYDD